MAVYEERNSVDEPLGVDDLEQALRLLLSPYRVQSWLHTRKGRVRALGEDAGERIEVDHYDRRGEWWRADVYHVSPELAALLKDRGLVSGRPQWGYTDQHQCAINARGEAELERLRAAREAEEA